MLRNTPLGLRLTKECLNASLDAGTRRAIDTFEGETIDEDAFKELIRAAVDVNVERAASKRRK